MTQEEFNKMFEALTPENKQKLIDKYNELLAEQEQLTSMSVRDLTEDQLTQVKQNYYTQKKAEAGEGVSYLELSTINDLVTDAEVFEEYAGTVFTPEDFT